MPLNELETPILPVEVAKAGPLQEFPEAFRPKQ